MRLVTFGCSNTYGVALENPSLEAWPAILGNELGVEVINNAVPGSSNLEILYNILKFDFKKDDLVIIMWTIVNRDYLFYDQQIGVWQNTPLVKNWALVHTDTDLIVRSWIYMDHANQYLKNQEIPVYNFAVDFVLLKSQMPKFINQTLLNARVDFHKFIDRAKDSSHPGPKAHARIAKKIKSFIKLEHI